MRFDVRDNDKLATNYTSPSQDSQEEQHKLGVKPRILSKKGESI